MSNSSFITVQRSGALGDVVLTTPIIRRLRRENPSAVIRVATAYGDVFRGNPHLVDPVIAVPGEDAERLIMLDLAYEKRPNLHVVQAYMETAFGDLGDPADLSQELFFPRKTVFSCDRKYIAVNAAVAGWANRTLSRETWLDVVNGLRKAGLWPILVGSPRDELPGCDVTRFFITDILAMAGFIAGCAAFVGSDSGLLHVAGATNTPIVGVFTCALPEVRLPWRHGVLGGGCTAIVPDLSCIGCLGRRPPPVTFEHCERGDNLCVSTVKANDIIAAVITAVDAQK